MRVKNVKHMERKSVIMNSQIQRKQWVERMKQQNEQILSMMNVPDMPGDSSDSDESSSVVSPQKLGKAALREKRDSILVMLKNPSIQNQSLP